MSKEQSHKWYRDKMTRLEELFATESHYAPYSDAELSDILGLSAETIRYWRVNYFGVGNTIERRYRYLQGDKDADRKQNEGTAAEGKGRRKTIEARTAAGSQQIAGDH